MRDHFLCVCLLSQSFIYISFLNSPRYCRDTMCDTISHIRKPKQDLQQNPVTWLIRSNILISWPLTVDSTLCYYSIQSFEESLKWAIFILLYPLFIDSVFFFFFGLSILPQPSSQCIFKQVLITTRLVLSWLSPLKSWAFSFQSKYLQFCTFYSSIFILGDPTILRTHLDVV